jgi:hypothetical protein
MSALSRRLSREAQQVEARSASGATIVPLYISESGCTNKTCTRLASSGVAILRSVNVQECQK